MKNYNKFQNDFIAGNHGSRHRGEVLIYRGIRFVHLYNTRRYLVDSCASDDDENRPIRIMVVCRWPRVRTISDIRQVSDKPISSI